MKGRAPVNQPQRCIIRLKFKEQEEQDLEAFKNKKNQMKEKRDNLKSQMLEEQKLSHLNRMKILTHWRKVLRLAKTEQLKKEI